LALRIRTLGDPVLRENCKPVDDISHNVKLIAGKMGETISEEPGRVGLAACQVGVIKRLFVYDVGHGVRCLINPEIVKKANEYVVEEGCLSIPGIQVRVPRYNNLGLRCTTLSGHRILFETEGFLAEIFQHECDHLDGILILDRCTEEDRKRAMDEYREIELQRRQAAV
jgi:peptide deformylase